MWGESGPDGRWRAGEGGCRWGRYWTDDEDQLPGGNHRSPSPHRPSGESSKTISFYQMFAPICSGFLSNELYVFFPFAKALG